MGRVTGRIFEQMGITTVGQVRQLAMAVLTAKFGTVGEHLWQLAHGIDERRVIPEREAQSVSNETTFATDIADLAVLRAWLWELAEQVAARLRKSQLFGRTVQLKVRYADFSTVTRAHTLPEATQATRLIGDTAVRLLESLLAGRSQSVRLLGVGVGGLRHSRQQQQTLFPDEDERRDTRLDAVRDQIQERFGKGALQLGSGAAAARGASDNTGTADRRLS